MEHSVNKCVFQSIGVYWDIYIVFTSPWQGTYIPAHSQSNTFIARILIIFDVFFASFWDWSNYSTAA